MAKWVSWLIAIGIAITTVAIHREDIGGWFEKTETNQVASQPGRETANRPNVPPGVRVIELKPGAEPIKFMLEGKRSLNWGFNQPKSQGYAIRVMKMDGTYHRPRTAGREGWIWVRPGETLNLRTELGAVWSIEFGLPPPGTMVRCLDGSRHIVGDRVTTLSITGRS